MIKVKANSYLVMPCLAALVIQASRWANWPCHLVNRSDDRHVRAVQSMGRLYT